MIRSKDVAHGLSVPKLKIDASENCEYCRCGTFSFTFTFTFSKAGTYPYFCSIHPKMIGKVIVQ